MPFSELNFQSTIGLMNQDKLKVLLLALSFEPTGQNSINATKMRHLKVPLPPLPEQQHFVAEI
jgi:restriction endonuclease S subunit